MSNNLILHIVKLTCYISDESDGDEIFLKMNGKKIWPEKENFKPMKGGTLPVGIEIKNIPEKSVVNIELWDYDFLSSNDLLGNFKLIMDKRGGPYNTDLTLNKKSDKARYNLEWELM
jgi:hypothetical protein